jgi:hypothetical protein
MAEASVEIPAGLVARVRESVVLLYAATAEGLHLALRAHGERDGPGEEVLLQRERLGRLDALLARMGWWRSGRGEGRVPARGGGALRLTAPADVLHDALYGALIDAGERLALACGESWRADGGLEEVREAAADVIALDRLLGEVRATGRAG